MNRLISVTTMAASTLRTQVHADGDIHAAPGVRQMRERAKSLPADHRGHLAALGGLGLGDPEAVSEGREVIAVRRHVKDFVQHFRGDAAMQEGADRLLKDGYELKRAATTDSVLLELIDKKDRNLRVTIMA